MRYRISNLPLWLDEDDALLTRRAAERLGLSAEHLRDAIVVRRSLDARRKGHARWLVNLEVEVEGAIRGAPADVAPVPAPEAEPGPVRRPAAPPVILGAGPAGLFCAWALLERGVPSIVVDRGKTVSPRRRDVAALMRGGALDPESNMNFGEGGAGAYTDGKLGTRIHHPAVRKVVELFARFGNVERIVVEGKPHVGSDVLPAAISAMREELERGGCTFVWGARAVDLALRDGRFAGLRLADGRSLESDRLVLAPGNSARELFELFAARGWPIEAKPFAVGFRAEHPQPLIDRIQYGAGARHPRLPPADYKLADNPKVAGAARGVFSFCMCPGGVVVPTPTEPEMQCTNGMSNSHRSSPVANAGIVVAVSPEDFAAEGFEGPLAGLEWQRKWERAAYVLGGGAYHAPAQRLAAYLARRPGAPPGKTSYRPGVTPSDLSLLYPPQIQEALRAGLRGFERRMRGFVTDEAVLIGIESRTSSPCRLVRGADFQSPGIRGLYPAGEGAGYAGGIVSSAVDGLKVAEAICAELGAA
ncbi:MULTISPECIES: NAD(P)/FAD-dependent oxidoreductase [unclassified Anaeromyxobacter]|uniref:NAD(P)/FAD-dependent oxidoreductase n=1 Tax=unclassified Anaeromyxobacter TaxID=2620896 RepID=UPI001F56346C|nr:MULTISPECIES: FAD-dependent oxidoreductase [unclassified Anaeromyxobacter]